MNACETKGEKNIYDVFFFLVVATLHLTASNGVFVWLFPPILLLLIHRLTVQSLRFSLRFNGAWQYSKMSIYSERERHQWPVAEREKNRRNKKWKQKKNYLKTKPMKHTRFAKSLNYAVAILCWWDYQMNKTRFIRAPIEFLSTTTTKKNPWT